MLKKGNFSEASRLLELHLSCPIESQCYEQLKAIFDQAYSKSVTVHVDNISLIAANKSKFNHEDLLLIHEYIKKMLCNDPLNNDEAKQKEKFKGIAEKIEKLKKSCQTFFSKRDIFK